MNRRSLGRGRGSGRRGRVDGRRRGTGDEDGLGDGDLLVDGGGLGAAARVHPDDDDVLAADEAGGQVSGRLLGDGMGGRLLSDGVLGRGHLGELRLDRNGVLGGGGNGHLARVLVLDGLGGDEAGGGQGQGCCGELHVEGWVCVCSSSREDVKVVD